jgi:hypothetical protein
MNKYLAIFLLLLSFACHAEPEEMFQVFREYDQEKVVHLLDAENIPYKIVNGNQFYYPLSYRDKVKKVKEKVWGPTDTSKKGVSVKNKDAPKLAAELVMNGISFNVSYGEGKTFFSWQSHYDKKAMKIVSDVVN